MNEQLLAWGASLHYPLIVLDRDKRIVLKPNEQSWRALLASDQRELIARLSARRARWSEYESKENER
jgi:hypothetical protein